MPTREVIIRIIEEGGSSEPSADAESSSSSEPSSDASSGGKKKKKDLKALMKQYVGKRIWSIAKNEAKYFTGKYFAATENYKAQNMVDNALDSVDSAVSTVFSAAFAYKAFESTAVGGGFGVAIAVGTAIVSKGISTFNSAFDMAKNITESTYGNYFYGERYGYVAGGHGTEN